MSAVLIYEWSFAWYLLAIYECFAQFKGSGSSLICHIISYNILLHIFHINKEIEKKFSYDYLENYTVYRITDITKYEHQLFDDTLL